MLERRERWLLAIVLAAYLPLIFLGLGSDGDADAVVRATHAWGTTGHYVHSRPPSFPIHELVTAVLHPIGGSIATNLGSLLAGLAVLATVMRLHREAGIPHGVLVACGIAVTPVFIIASTSTMDYTWSAACLFGGLLAWARQRPWIAGVLLGLAVGARLSAAAPVIAFILAVVMGSDRRAKPLGIAASIAVVVAALCYVPPFVTSGYSTSFIGYSVPDWWGGWTVIARFIYKNIYLVGLQTCVAVAVVIAVARPWPPQVLGRSWLIPVAALTVLATEAVFLRVPIEPAYLLPAIPAMWILAAHWLRQRPRLLMTLIIVQASYNVVSFNIARADVPRAARSAELGFWVEPGPLVRDIDDRRALQENRPEPFRR